MNLRTRRKPIRKLWTNLVGGPWNGAKILLTDQGDGSVSTAPLVINGHYGVYRGHGATTKHTKCESHWEELA
jgi:hypothetical protein